MSEEVDRQILETLREIRDGQGEIVTALGVQRALVEEQIKASRTRVEESIGLQREGLRRQRTVLRLAAIGIAACIAGIAYLLLRYF